jgi:hypothetical protein
MKSRKKPNHEQLSASAKLRWVIRGGGNKDTMAILTVAGVMVAPQFADWKSLDLRRPVDNPLLKMGCYPKGAVPGVKLSVMRT